MKKIIIYIVFVLLLSIVNNVFTKDMSLSAQNIEAFELVMLPAMDSVIPLKSYKLYFNVFCNIGNLSYFPNENMMAIRDEITGELILLNKANGDFTGTVNNIFHQPYSNTALVFGPRILTLEGKQILKEYPDVIPSGVLYRFAMFPYIEWEKHYTKSDVYIYFMVNDTLKKVSPDNIDNKIILGIDTTTSHNKDYPNWSKIREDFFINNTDNLNNTAIVLPDSTVWMIPNHKQILRFDEKTKEFTRWDVDSIAPVANDRTVWLDALHLIKDNDNPHNSQLIAIAYRNNFANPELLLWENGSWRLEKLVFEGSKLFARDNDSLSKLQILSTRIFDWSKDEIAFSIYSIAANSVDTLTVSRNTRTLLLYNYKTKQTRDFTIPVELFKNNVLHKANKGLPFAVQHYVNYINDLDNGKKGILITCDRVATCSCFYIIYDPSKDTTNFISETDAGIIPDLWIRNIYPNPVTHNKITANIMCYVPDISTVELALYNFMGQKVLDLTNSFEYDPSTATISITFDFPKYLAKGTYYLNVRNNGETRTSGIMLGK